MKACMNPTKVYLLAVLAFSFAVFYYISMEITQNFSEFNSRDIDGKIVNLSELHGKVLFITNVASKCGYTDRDYKELQALHEKYHTEGLEILAFPCNQFGGQEPDDDPAIKSFVKERYGVQFRMFSKIDVNGENAEPLFKYLKEATGGADIKWNFEKFLVARDGTVIKRALTKTSPLELENDIQYLLKN